MYYLSISEEDFNDNILRVKEWAESEGKYLEYIIEMKGSPLNAMHFLSSSLKSKSTLDLLKKDYRMFKSHSSMAARLMVLAAQRDGVNGDYIPYNLLSDGVLESIFYSVMSDDELIISWHIRNIDKIGRANTLNNKYDVSDFMIYTILLTINGEEKAVVIERCNKIIKCNYKLDEDVLLGCKFMIGLSLGYVSEMKSIINSFISNRKKSRRLAKDTLAFLDFYLQPQALFYGKLASRYGFDLGIDDEIAPKELIEYKPLDEYIAPYDFMNKYNWEAPYEFQYEWINKFQPKK